MSRFNSSIEFDDQYELYDQYERNIDGCPGAIYYNTQEVQTIRKIFRPLDRWDEV